jgi:hypothetical protein
MPIPAQLRLIRAAVTNARVDPHARAAGRFVVDGEFHLDFEPEGEDPASWTCGTYPQIDVAPERPALEAQLEFIARSAADDVVYDMREAGYEASGNTAELPIVWTVAPDVRARFEGS